MTKYLSFILPLLIGFAMMGCSDSDSDNFNENLPRIDIVLTQQEKEVAQAQYDFPVKLLSAAYETQGKGCTMVSPVSASMVLGMVANAIDSTERAEIFNVLNIKDNNDLQSYNAYMQKLLDNMPIIDKKSTFSMANAFRLANDAILSDSYASLLDNYYHADLGRFDKFDISVIDEINRWSDEKTKGGIPEILTDKDANDSTKTAWINALYFNGFWSKKFDKSKTHKSPFYHNFPDETTFTNVDMMKGKGCSFKFPTKESSDYGDWVNVAIIPYGNESYTFIGILPPLNNPEIATTLNKLDSNFWTKLDNLCMNNLSRPDADVFLPKMSIAKENDLIPALRSIGLNSLLNEYIGASMQDNLGYIIPKYLNIFRQKAVLDLDENGTTIKVVTVTTGLDISSIDPLIVFNRPFIYFIRERSTGAVLLAGVYTM